MGARSESSKMAVRYSQVARRGSASGGTLPDDGMTSEGEEYTKFEGPRQGLSLHDSRPSAAAQQELDEMSLTSKRMMIAGGFLDIALFTTNCEQLKFAIESQHLTSPGRFKFILTMLAVSLILQAVMALLFFSVGFLAEKKSSQQRQRFINNVIMLLVALVTLVNIVISTFSNKGEMAKFCMTMKNENGIYDDVFIGNSTENLN